MFRIFILLFTLTSSLSLAQGPQCVDLFVLEATSSASQTQLLMEQMDTVSKEGKWAIRSRSFTPANKKYFESILKLNHSELNEFKTSELLDVYSLFAKWNLIPPTRFQNRLFRVLKARLQDWTAKDFQSFAITRKLTPAPILNSFLNPMREQAIKKFESFDVVTQMEFLSTEIFHESPITLNEMNFLLETVTNKLNNSSYVPRLKPLKETYRSLMFLRTVQTSMFYIPVLKLTSAIERKMGQQSLTLDADGTSGAINQPVTKKYKRIRFEARLDELHRGDTRIDEYANPSEVGFYDPVDIFYPTSALVVEWDGPHHYFQQLQASERGNIQGFTGEILRPIDQMRDKILRYRGYRVLRISMALNDSLETMDIALEIKKQNPL